MDNKDLISQYVDTGLSLPEYQVERLSKNEKKTYIRKRLIAIRDTVKPLTKYEFNLLDDSNKLEYIKNRIRTGIFLGEHEWDFIPNDIKIELLYNKIQKNKGILFDYEWNSAPDNIKIKCIETFIKTNKEYDMPEHQFKWLMSQNNHDLINQYIDLSKELFIPNYQENIIRDYQFNMSSDRDKLIKIKNELKNENNVLSEIKFEWLIKQNNAELISEYIKKIYGLPEKQLEKLPDWAIENYIKFRFFHTKQLHRRMYDYELKHLYKISI